MSSTRAVVTESSRDGATDGLLRSVAEHNFGCLVPGTDDAVQVLADDCVVPAPENAAATDLRSFIDTLAYVSVFLPRAFLRPGSIPVAQTRRVKTIGPNHAAPPVPDVSGSVGHP
jgi:hypothetical protein